MNMIPSKLGETMEMKSDQKIKITHAAAQPEPKNAITKLDPASVPEGNKNNCDQCNKSIKYKENETTPKAKEPQDEKKTNNNFLESEKQRFTSILSAILTDQELLQSVSQAKDVVVQESKNIWKRISQLDNSGQLPKKQTNIQKEENEK